MSPCAPGFLKEGDSIYSYQTNASDGVLFQGAVLPAGALITANDIGVFGLGFADGVSLSYATGSANVVVVGNSLKGSSAAFFSGTVQTRPVCSPKIV
jgi:hypothetical protein